VKQIVSRDFLLVKKDKTDIPKIETIWYYHKYLQISI